MKKRKTFGLYGTNKRKTAKRADKYTEEFYEAFDDDADGFYTEDGAYGAAPYAEEFAQEFEDGAYDGVTFADDEADEAYGSEAYENASYTEEAYEDAFYAEDEVYVSDACENASYMEEDAYEDASYAEEFAQEFEDDAYDGVTFADEDDEAYGDGAYENASYEDNGAYEDVPYADSGAYESASYEENGAYEDVPYADSGAYESASYAENGVYEDAAYMEEEACEDAGYAQEFEDEAYDGVTFADEDDEAYGDGVYENVSCAEGNSYDGGADPDDTYGGTAYADAYAQDEYAEPVYNEDAYADEEAYADEAYEDYEDGYETAYGDMDASDMYDMYEEDAVELGPDLQGGFGARILQWLRNMTAFDVILASTGVILVVAAVVAGSMYLETRRINEGIEALAPMGEELANVGIVGEDGLYAMTSSALSGQFAAELESETISSMEVVDVDAPAASSGRVNVNFTSVEKDLKIRFTDADTGQLITGTVFEVVLTNAKGKRLVLTDDDMDGIIYAQNVNPGKFDAVITSTDKYQFPEQAQQVTVKDKVEYVVIHDVQDEVKKESQVNVAVEDTQKQDAQKEEEKIKDTVEWVESTKTLIGGTEGYLPVDKNTIADPSQAARAAARMLFDTLNVTLDKTALTLTIGSSADLSGTKYSDSTEGDVSYKYTTEWKSSNESVASVSDGKVTAKAAGTATITYTVTKKTITTEKVEGETQTSTTTEEKELSEAEYEAYKKETEAKSDEKTEYKVEGTKGDAVTGEASTEPSGETKYKYTITITTTQKGEGTTKTSETSETASASCEVTVKAAGITAASLELSKSADSCNVGSTLTVKPSKLVYTKEDGTKEEVTSFPTVTWASSDKAIATIDANGVVTGVKAGKVTITATITGIKGADGKELPISATIDVTISEAPVFSLTLDRTSEVYLAVRGQTTLVATVKNYKSDSGVTWESSDKKIATVDEKGVVTGVSAGKVTITATTKEKGADGKPLKATCIVTINSDATSDTTTKLKDKNGNQIYIKDKDGNYKEAVYADYFTAPEFYIRTEGQYAYTGWQTINGKTYYYDKNGKVVTGTQVIQGVTYNFDSTGAIAASVNGSTFGIDVSRHNGNIDWNAVKASGVDYVIIRCGYRGSATGVLVEDENFKKNIKGATAAGLKVGIYVFSQAVDEVEAVKEASLAVSLAKGYNLTYPIFIDTESSGGRADKIDTATRTAVVNAFCQTVANAGYQPGIYASKSWYETKLNMSAIGNYKIWLAQYAAAPSYKGRYDMWQYSSKGTISGISGKVDLNLSYLGY